MRLVWARMWKITEAHSPGTCQCDVCMACQAAIATWPVRKPSNFSTSIPAQPAYNTSLAPGRAPIIRPRP